MSLAYVPLTLDEYVALDLEAYVGLPVEISDATSGVAGDLIYGSSVVAGGKQLSEGREYISKRDRVFLVHLETITNLFNHGSLSYQNYRR